MFCLELGRLAVGPSLVRNNVLVALRVSRRLALDRLLVDDAPGLHFELLPDPAIRGSWGTTGSDDLGRVSAPRYVEGIPGVPRPSRPLGLGEPPMTKVPHGGTRRRWRHSDRVAVRVLHGGDVVSRVAGGQDERPKNGTLALRAIRELKAKNEKNPHSSPLSVSRS